MQTHTYKGGHFVFVIKSNGGLVNCIQVKYKGRYSFVIFISLLEVPLEQNKKIYLIYAPQYVAVYIENIQYYNIFSSVGASICMYILYIYLCIHIHDYVFIITYIPKHTHIYIYTHKFQMKKTRKKRKKLTVIYYYINIQGYNCC